MPDSVVDSAQDHADEPAMADATETHDDARAAANLTKDVAKWSVDRHTRERIEEEGFEKNPMPTPPPAPKPRAKPKPAAAPVAAAAAPSTEKKPFSMSFGGISNEDYIASLRAKGRR